MKIYNTRCTVPLASFLETTGIAYVEIEQKETICEILEQYPKAFSDYTVSQIIELFPDPTQILAFLCTEMIPDSWCDEHGCKYINCVCEENAQKEIRDELNFN